MSLEAECCYRRLLDVQWMSGAIPSDIATLARLCKNIPVRRMRSIWTEIAPCFIPATDGQGLVNPKLAAIREGVVAFRRERAESGRLGGLRSGEARSKHEAELPVERSSASVQHEANTQAKRTFPFPFPFPDPDPGKIPFVSEGGAGGSAAAEAAPAERGNKESPQAEGGGDSGAGKGRAPRKAAPRTKAPEYMTVTEDMRRWARDEGVTADLDSETRAMLDHHRARGNLQADWIAAWRTWMRRAKQFAPARAATGGRGRELAIIAPLDRPDEDAINRRAAEQLAALARGERI